MFRRSSASSVRPAPAASLNHPNICTIYDVGINPPFMAMELLESRLTDEGVAVGTVAYMSPEQLRGRPLDPRSDLFALGLVVYEMVTGRPAFDGETNAVVAAAILQETPVLPRHIRVDVPARLEDLILDTMEKDPRDRPQSAAELRANLRRCKRELEELGLFLDG
jgi:non-specific serine/threonine protein kinase